MMRTQKCLSGLLHANVLLRGGISFSIKPTDLLPLPTHCPVFGFRLQYRSRIRFNPRSASIDRVNAKRGYTRRNIVIVSLKANLIKRNATAKEIQAVANFYTTLATSRHTS